MIVMKLDVPPMRLLLLRQYTCDMCAYVRVQTCFIHRMCFQCFVRHEYAWNAATYQALKCEWRGQIDRPKIPCTVVAHSGLQ